MPFCPLLVPFSYEPVFFESKPVASAVREGARLFTSRKGADSVWRGDQVGIGKWFDGHRKREVEEVLWLSPSAVSRRLGYLQAQEGWSEATLQNRWIQAKQAFGGRLTFVARICAFPRDDIFEAGLETNHPSLEPLAPTARLNGHIEALEQTILEERVEESSDRALPNWIAHPEFAPLKGVLDIYEPPMYTGGAFQSRLLLLSCRLEFSARMEVVLATPGKQRTGTIPVIGQRRYR